MSGASHATLPKALALALVVFAFILAGPARAEAAKRVALVIGNGAYQFAPKLDNPPLDARAVAASLRRIGFQVTEGYDLSVADMRSTLARFSDALAGSSAALVYYAGHGVSVDDENYLLPVDIRLKSPTDLDFNAVSVSLVMRQLRRDERVNVVILDACRDNPFAVELARAKSRAAIGERGLSRVDGDLARGSLIAFASDPRSVALDGPSGEHSPFTKALLEHLEDPGVSIDTTMARVRADVWSETHKKQLPWVNTSIIGEFALNPAPAAAAAPPPPKPDQTAREDLLWESAQHSGLGGDYRAYLDAYPDGAFAQMARNRIAALEPGAPAPVSRASGAAENAPPSPESADEAAEQTLGLAPAARREVQLRLNLLGFSVGQPDGVFADRTRAAIREWQRRHELDASGFLPPPQYSTLKSESEAAYQRFARTPSSLAPAPPPAARPRAMTPYVAKPTAPERRRRLVDQAPAEIRPPAPSLAPVGPCGPGMHTVAFPNRQGFRCVQDGY